MYVIRYFMTKKPEIYVYIIESPLKYSRFNLLGRELNSYVKLAFADTPHSVVECEKEVDFNDKYEYLAVLYVNMPLVTPEILYETAKLMKSKGHNRAEFGDGYICNVEGFCETQYKISLNTREFLSVNDAITLKLVYNEIKRRILERHLERGVIILDDNNTIDDTVIIGEGAVIEGGATLVGNTVIGSGTRIIASRIEDSVIGKNVSVGPFSFIRLNACIGDNVRIGDFVEIKKSTLGNGVKSAHLSYIGDASVGENTNVGCGTVFCNYDGVNKHKTVVGKNVFIGANTNLVAPLTVGNHVFIAAGTTVTDDLDDEKFCIGRVRQDVKPRRK